jgi:hypothetical protein
MADLLPEKMERCIATLAKVYGHDGKKQLQEILVNAQVHVDERISVPSWVGGKYGHGVRLTLPENIFLGAVSKKVAFQNEIKKDLNALHHVKNELVEDVSLELELETDEWRERSGLLEKVKRSVPPDATKRIWGDSGFRLFMSHRAEVQAETAALKEKLKLFGISSFVAHVDIYPTKTWQDEIENALATMDGFVALMTPDFHLSEWTDQEVGHAVCRGVPTIAVNLGMTPYGFLAKFQALTCEWDTVHIEIVKILVRQDKWVSGYIDALRKCTQFEEGNKMAIALPWIERLSENQVDDLIGAYNANPELQGAFGFNGEYTRKYGNGLVSHLHRLSSRRFQYSEGKKSIEKEGTPKKPKPKVEDDDVPF